MASKYTPPDWSAPPKYECGLEVIKHGAVVETIDLSTRSYFLIGRDASVVHIPLAHETISRQHAALQFDESGELYVVDLGSSHGTKLNRQALRPKQFQSVPVGGTLQFGASTRFYVLQGPDELLPPEEESAELAQKRAAADRKKREIAARSARAAQAGAAASSAARAAGGDADEAALKADQDMEADIDSMPLTAETVHANDRALFQKLQAARNKLNAAAREAEILKGKQAAANSSHHAGQFTEGQQRALASMDARLEAAHTAVEEGEAAIRQRMHARRRAAAGGRGGSGVVGGGEFSSRAGTRALNEGSRTERQFLQSEEADFDEDGAPSGRATTVVRHAWARKGAGKKSTAASFIKKRAGVSRGGAAGDASAPPPVELVGVSLSGLETAGSLQKKLADLAAQTRKQESQLVAAEGRAKRAEALHAKLEQGGQGGSVDGVVAASELEAARGAAAAISKHLSGLAASREHLGKLLALTGEQPAPAAAAPAPAAAAAAAAAPGVPVLSSAKRGGAPSSAAAAPEAVAAASTKPDAAAAEAAAPAAGSAPAQLVQGADGGGGAGGHTGGMPDMRPPSLPVAADGTQPSKTQEKPVHSATSSETSLANTAAPATSATAGSPSTAASSIGGTKRGLEEAGSSAAPPERAPQPPPAGDAGGGATAAAAPVDPAAARAKRARLARRDVQMHYEGDGEGV